MKISYGITVHNEAKELERLLTVLNTNIDKEDEIVVCVDGDDESVKKVLDECLASWHTDTIYHRKLDGDFSAHKNSVIEKSTGDYVFHIDADEYPNEILLQQLKQILEINDVDLLWIPRVNTVEGFTEQDVKRWGWNISEQGWVNYPDYQARVFIPTGTETFNSDGADVQGLEIEVDWIATDQFRIAATASVMNSEFKALLAQDPMFPEGGFVNIDGNSLLRAPDLQASIAASYDIPLESGLLTLQGDVSYLDEQHHSIWNNPAQIQPSREMVNLRVFFEPARIENLTFSAFVQNATSDVYSPMIIGSGLVGGIVKAYGAPRTWGVELRYAN